MPLDNLNTEQYNSATSIIGHNLTIASAGTGKTSTIVGRIAYLLKNGIAICTLFVCVFTFTQANNESIDTKSYGEFSNSLIASAKDADFYLTKTWLTIKI